MNARIGDIKIRMRQNPKKTSAVSLFALLVLLAGMYQVGIADQQLENDTDFDYGELDPNPENESSNSSDNDVSENNSINVSVTNQTCISHENGSNYCVSG